MTDWRLPENRREAFQRFYTFHLTYRTHPGCVYFWLPDIVEHYGLDVEQQAWLVWLNGNTENPVTSLLLLEAAPYAEDWRQAVAFWNDHFKDLEWDTDRRHQKSKFGLATEQWRERFPEPWSEWVAAGRQGWQSAWRYSLSQPYMGRLSAWSMLEYAKILWGRDVPDMGSLLLEDASGSRSHRNSLGWLAGYDDAVYWPAEKAKDKALVLDLQMLGDDLLAEACERNPQYLSDVTRLTLESALCTYKSWHKPNRRYPNVYADMAYLRLKKAESRFGHREAFDVLWESRRRRLPAYLRLEDQPYDPGLTGVKQNHYLETGEVPMMYHLWPDMRSQFDDAVDLGLYGERKDPK